MRTVWGFGLFRIGFDAGEYIDFTNSMGKLVYVEEFNEYTSLSGTFKRVSKGWRPRISVDIYNVCDTDHTNLRRLLEYINTIKSRGGTFWIVPRYDSSYDNTEQILIYAELVSDINLEDIANTQVGQRITLEFLGRDRVTSLPTVESSAVENNWIDNGVDNYVDESGILYVMAS